MDSRLMPRSRGPRRAGSAGRGGTDLELYADQSPYLKSAALSREAARGAPDQTIAAYFAATRRSHEYNSGAGRKGCRRCRACVESQLTRPSTSFWGKQYLGRV